LLGLVELKPLVEQAFARGFINNSWPGFKDFEEDPQQATDDPAELPRRSRGKYTRFGDTLEEPSKWCGVSLEDVRYKERKRLARLLSCRCRSNR